MDKYPIFKIKLVVLYHINEDMGMIFMSELVSW